MKRYCNYLPLDKKICYICDNEYMYFLNKLNVIGVGLGYKIINGLNTLEKCIKVFVCRKVSYNRIYNNDLIPFLYKGIKTDVVESGILKGSLLTNRIRPIIGGYSIGPSNINGSGSIGCLVKDKCGIYILSNNHVLADENRLKLGTFIVQPSFVDGGKYTTDTVGKLSSYIPLRFETSKETPVNYVDAAIAKVDNPKIASPNIALIGKINGIKKNLVLNEDVQKVGSTTEHTFGKITCLNGTFKINYSDTTTPKDALFKDIITTSKISDDGDSGCVLLDNNKYVVGILTATADSISAFNPIQRVLDSFRVSIVK